MSRRSTVAVSTLTPALKVLSTTLPDITFFSLVCTKAGPLPGLTCWNSTTDHSWPSRLSTRPFFRSLVDAHVSRFLAVRRGRVRAAREAQTVRVGDPRQSSGRRCVLESPTVPGRTRISPGGRAAQTPIVRLATNPEDASPVTVRCALLVVAEHVVGRQRGPRRFRTLRS